MTNLEKRNQYKERKEKGLCTKCGQPAVKGKSYCQGHRLEANYSRRRYTLKHQHGLSVEEYKQLVDAQLNHCAICGWKWKEGHKNLALDHSHLTGKIRGLLCNKCNTGLGLFNDDPRLLRNAIQYLEDNP
jgi:hypothetical protein